MVDRLIEEGGAKNRCRGNSMSERHLTVAHEQVTLIQGRLRGHPSQTSGQRIGMSDECVCTCSATKADDEE
jgi:hypothetical protein